MLIHREEGSSNANHPAHMLHVHGGSTSGNSTSNGNRSTPWRVPHRGLRWNVDRQRINIAKVFHSFQAFKPANHYERKRTTAAISLSLITVKYPCSNKTCSRTATRPQDSTNITGVLGVTYASCDLRPYFVHQRSFLPHDKAATTRTARSCRRSGQQWLLVYCWTRRSTH